MMLEVSQAIEMNGLADVAGKLMVQAFLRPNKYTKSQLVEAVLLHDSSSLEVVDAVLALGVLKKRHWLQENESLEQPGPPRYSVSDTFITTAAAVRMRVTTMSLKDVQQPYNNAVDDLREVQEHPQHIPARLRYLGAIAFLGESYNLEHILGDESKLWLPGKSGWELLTALDATSRSS